MQISSFDSGIDADTFTGGVRSGTIRYVSDHGSDIINRFITGLGRHIFSFSGIATALDFVQSGSNILFLVGDGIARYRQFGIGGVLIALTYTSFT